MSIDPKERDISNTEYFRNPRLYLGLSILGLIVGIVLFYLLYHPPSLQEQQYVQARKYFIFIGGGFVFIALVLSALLFSRVQAIAKNPPPPAPASNGAEPARFVPLSKPPGYDAISNFYILCFFLGLVFFAVSIASCYAYPPKPAPTAQHKNTGQ